MRSPGHWRPLRSPGVRRWGELALLRALAEQPQSMGLLAPEGPLARGLLGFLVTALVIGLGWVLLR